jgi:hypothetical protein
MRSIDPRWRGAIPRNVCLRESRVFRFLAYGPRLRRRRGGGRREPPLGLLRPGILACFGAAPAHLRLAPPQIRAQGVGETPLLGQFRGRKSGPRLSWAVNRRGLFFLVHEYPLHAGRF